MEKATIAPFHVNITDNNDWLEDVYAIMNQFPDRLPPRKPLESGLDQRIEYYAAAGYNLVEDDINDEEFDDDPTAAAEAPQEVKAEDKFEARNRYLQGQGHLDQFNVLDEVNQVCAAHRRGVALPTQMRATGMPNALFYPGYVWSEEDYQTFVLLKGALPVHLHTGTMGKSDCQVYTPLT
jgi:hypothetical protein